jgi:hypothetical protein
MLVPWQQPAVIAHSGLLAASYRRWTGRDLLGAAIAGGSLARDLYHAPFALLSHGTEADPLFNYANLKAQGLWELDWDYLIGTPSRRSAEAGAQADRSEALTAALQHGFVANYSGIRIAASGRRFRIEDGVIWNLMDAYERLQGQAAMFSRWQFL